MKTIVILTGAGISAESGLKTFRASDGLWEDHSVYDVATFDAWTRDPELVLRFYNERRKQIRSAEPNSAHLALAALEQQYHVHIVTQNIDDLHERAGSSHVLHLHGEINQARSTLDSDLVYELEDWEMKMGDVCEKGSQLRPNIVWFGEAVPMMGAAINIAEQADIFMVIGTSLQVYPAASLSDYTRSDIPKYYIDPNGNKSAGFEIIKEKASMGVPSLVKSLMK